jgi:predicted PurR-regulated permease PerM
VLVTVLLLLSLYAFRTALIPLIVGAIIAYVLYPVARQISKLTKLKHGMAVTVLYLLIVIPVVTLAVLLIPVIARQAINFQQTIVTFLQSIDLGGTLAIPLVNTEIEVQQVVDRITESLSALVSNFLNEGLGVILTVGQVVIYGIFTIIISFYLTKDGASFISNAIDAMPDGFREEFRNLLQNLDRVWRAFVRGQLLLSFTVFVILTILASILGLPQPLLIGLLGGLLEFLPSIGNVIWGITVIIVALASGSTWIDVPPATFAIIVAIAYVAFAQLDINVLIPNIIGGQVSLHPAVVLIGVIVGLQVGGVLGVALAAPTIASARVILRYIYAKIFDQEPFSPLPVIEESAPPQLEDEASESEA